ncbi:selenium binding protein [Flavobacterium cupreum]|uniref:Selenium binding protein n=1 Tax=Flavobacterium cupreum TaxID=2133766 RepID=A0A434A0G1_9FLAO|nr:selenium binding protein [Flavobacterium cupreum]RUT67858.1 selenium binding protein [Flavobacterium cupreum]
MYEEYSRQVLPSKRYRELLGSAICVFNSNNQFIIENILRIDDSNYNWHELIDKTSGSLLQSVKETISKNSDTKIAVLFSSIIVKRNRIIHSYQITENDQQILSTKTKNNKQFTITESYLLEFIKDNEHLSLMLHKLRGY